MIQHIVEVILNTTYLKLYGLIYLNLNTYAQALKIFYNDQSKALKKKITRNLPQEIYLVLYSLQKKNHNQYQYQLDLEINAKRN